ncbi:MAG: hypothetical protein QM811_12545 [Pirellulales bacterium]
MLRRACWERAAKSMTSIVSSPFSSSTPTLPVHWLWLDGLRATMPMENRLPRGDMESLEAMAAAGWRHGRSTQEDLRALLEIERQIDAPSHGALRMRIARAKTPVNGERKEKSSDAETVGLLESPPLWITSPAIPVRAGEWICIRGKINVPQQIRGSVDGVMIVDSLGGETLAERIDKTKGWQEFVLYRIATKNEPITVTIALTGYGEVLLDDVTVRAMARPANGQPPPNAGPSLNGLDRVPGVTSETPGRFQIVPARPEGQNGVAPQPTAGRRRPLS